jgi:Do/DeqQ family serine protease
MNSGRLLSPAIFLLAAFLSAAGAFVPSPAPAREVPDTREQIRLSFAPVVRQAVPAVVNIYTRRLVRERISPLFDDPLFRRFFGDGGMIGRPRERVQNSLGSGVILDPSGLIVTNHHVIEGADEITVALADRREFEAVLVTSDPRTDLAVLRIQPPRGESLPYLEMGDSDGLEVGDLVLAIGNPFGVGQTVTSGIVSAIARTAVGINDFDFFIQTDAAINPGNSGGALVTMDGRLAGINTAIFSRSGGNMGIGFAVPSNMVRTVVDAVRAGAPVIRAWLGVAGQPVTPDIAASLGLPRPVGVLVNGVDPASPATAAGLRVGDVVTAVNGLEVDSPDALRFRVATLRVGSRATMTVMRDGKPRDLAFAVIAPPEDPPRDVTPLAGRHPLSGVKAANLSPALAEEIGIPTQTRGVIVLDVARGSIAERLGVASGDIVLRINDTEVRDVRSLARLLGRGASSWTLSVRRGDRVLTTQVAG